MQSKNSIYLAEKRVWSAVEISLLGTGLLARHVTEGVNDLVGVDQVLVRRLRYEAAFALLWKRR